MIKNLVISGGSMTTISVIGALRFLEEQNLLKSIDTFVGTSAGSMLCFLLTLGYTSDAIRDILKQDFFGNNLHKLDIDELLSLNILTSYGMDSGENLTKFLENWLFLKLNVRDITFSDLTKTTGKNLVVCCANITLGDTEYFCVDNYANTSVIQAIRMSSSIPFIYTPIKFKNCYYVDGGLYECFPIKYIERFKDPLKDTIGIYTSNNNCYNQSIYNKIDNMFDYISTLFRSVVNKVNSLQNHSINTKIKLINIDFEMEDSICFNYDSLSFDVDEERIDAYIEKGYNVMKQCFDTRIS
jgi:NTE family protein